VNVPGHLAVAYLALVQARRMEGSLARRGAPRLDRLGIERLAITAFGALLPDLIDKPLMWIGATPYGRTVGHSVLLWCAALTLALIVGRRSIGLSALLLIGGFSHLAVDLIDDLAEGLERSGYVFSAWMGWPVTNPDMAYVQMPHLLEPMRYAVTSLEIATVAACLWHAVSRRD